MIYFKYKVTFGTDFFLWEPNKNYLSIFLSNPWNHIQDGLWFRPGRYSVEDPERDVITVETQKRDWIHWIIPLSFELKSGIHKMVRNQSISMSWELLDW